MKRVAVIAPLMLAASGVAWANFCARDVVPAATLLFPYVRVDMAGESPDPSGWTTITGITNVGRQAVIVHFTVWDITSVPRYNFAEILSGYDVLEIDWRDVLRGRFDLFDTSRAAFKASPPLTLDPFEWGPDGGRQTNIDGQLTTPQNRSGITTAQCPGWPPYGNRSDLSSTIIATLRASLIAYSHTACRRSLREDKTSWVPGEGVGTYPLAFYVTADVVNECNLTLPDDAAYWALHARNNNVLIGDVTYRNGEKRYSEILPAVHIEAAASVSRAVTYPFYGERTTAETHREPLATAFAFRYTNEPESKMGSDVILWKNFAEVPRSGQVSDCGSFLYYAWDNDERSLALVTLPRPGPAWGDPNQFPFGTQKVPLTTAYFDLPAARGWMLIVLPPSYVFSSGWRDPSNDSATLNTTGTTTAPKYYMGWVGVELTQGGYSTSVEAATLANYMCYAAQKSPALGSNPGGSAVAPYGFIQP